MTKAKAQQLQGAIALVGTLFVLGVKLYAIGWWDEPWIVAVTLAIPIAVFAWWWHYTNEKDRVSRRAINDRWEARERLRQREAARETPDDQPDSQP